jgi:hypothetical protein
MDRWGLQKKDIALLYVRKIKPHIGDNAMSTSMLNHTFKAPGVQYISTFFLKAKPFFIASYTQTLKNAPIASPAKSYILELSSGPLKCCQSGIIKQR